MRPFLKVHPALELAELRATALLGPGTGSALSIGTIPWLQQHSLQVSSSSALPRPGKGVWFVEGKLPHTRSIRLTVTNIPRLSPIQVPECGRHG